MVAESAGKPAQADEALKEAQQASVQEIQSLKTSLNQAQSRITELEAQVDSMQKVFIIFLSVFTCHCVAIWLCLKIMGKRKFR